MYRDYQIVSEPSEESYNNISCARERNVRSVLADRRLIQKPVYCHAKLMAA
jgi:hypothetical protein